MTSPTVSVLMSVWNGEPFLERAVESLLSQTYSDFELLVVDDASTDATPEILEHYRRSDSRVRVVTNARNRGLAASLNFLLEQARGPLVARMDSDDVSHPDRLERQVRHFRDHSEMDVCFTGTVLIDRHGEEVCRSWRPESVDEILDVLDAVCFIPHPTVMVRRQTLSSAGGYDESYRTGQDQELWCRLRDRGANFHYLPRPLLDLRITPGSVRAEDHHSYWYRVARICLWNRHRRAALSYWERLSPWERVRLGLRACVPFPLAYRLTIARWRL